MFFNHRSDQQHGPYWWKNTLYGELEHVGDNSIVSILHWTIGVHHKCNIRIMQIYSVGINRLYHINHLVDLRVVLRAEASVGSTSQYFGAGVIKVDVLSLGCISRVDGLHDHHPGKILPHLRILMDVGGFICDCIVCSLSEVERIIIVINVDSASIICIWGINISNMLPRWHGWGGGGQTGGRTSCRIGLIVILIWDINDYNVNISGGID